ncbi:MAG TPA: UDP-N-acetylglucosamine 4,6-dehydratase (inverting) [Longimicrobiales bacterium]|nr:UDP-N-acetylglucosamine 4,6-dehydratase (inverting) [Longimicrobiales bacterium]
MNGRSILVTGGTGFFGRTFVGEVLRRWPDVSRLVVFSRDELKQYEMAQAYPQSRHPQLRFFIGDVRSRERLRRALEGIDTVVHAAALKQVPAGEYNPIEFINTNIIGAENLVEACMDAGVRRVVALSTDKAAAPINLYGATKLCSDKLFVAANNFRGGRDLSFSVVRYGNIMGSRGSVIPYFIERARTGVLPITDRRMTRFNMRITDAVEMVLWALENSYGGEIFVAKNPSYRLVDLAEAIGPGCRLDIIGIRPGEKIHEEMITASDSHTTVDVGDYFAILPTTGVLTAERYSDHMPATAVEPGFLYHSGRNDHFLDVDTLRGLIRDHIDPAFEPV